MTARGVQLSRTIDPRGIPSLEEVHAAVHNALRKLYGKDGDLFEVGANERSITHRLALYLDAAPIFRHWNVDCEYNKIGDLPKRIRAWESHPRYDDLDAISVYPDIIVHKRRLPENLLVIEAKRGSLGGQIDLRDKEKLEGYIEELGYRFGLWIAFNGTKDDAVKIWFENSNGRCSQVDLGALP